MSKEVEYILLIVQNSGIWLLDVTCQETMWEWEISQQHIKISEVQIKRTTNHNIKILLC